MKDSRVPESSDFDMENQKEVGEQASGPETATWQKRAEFCWSLFIALAYWMRWTSKQGYQLRTAPLNTSVLIFSYEK